jgi:hypothetical protein
MMPVKAQSYMGKSPILKGMGRLYGGLWRLFSGGGHNVACNKGRPDRSREPRLRPDEAAIELPICVQNALILLVGETRDAL